MVEYTEGIQKNLKGKIMSNYQLDRDTELALKQSHPDFYRLLREFAVDEKPYHETLDKEKLKREIDLGLWKCEELFSKKDIMEAVETFEGEKSIKTTLRKTASVGTTEIATEYYYISCYNVGMRNLISEVYLGSYEDHKGINKIYVGNKVFCYSEGYVSEGEANLRIDMFLTDHFGLGDNLELAP